MSHIIISEAGVNPSNITVVARGTNKFTTSAPPVASANDPVTVRNSTGNDGSYTIKSIVGSVTEINTKFAHKITGVNATLNAFIISGDVTAILTTPGQVINVQGSTGNDGVYTVTSVINNNIGYDIKSINKTLSVFVVDGDQTDYFVEGTSFSIKNSNGDVKKYVTASATFDGTNTLITVTTTVDAKPDGTIFITDKTANPSTIVNVQQTIPNTVADGNAYYAIQDPTADGQLVWYTDDSTNFKLHFTDKSDIQTIKKGTVTVSTRNDKIVITSNLNGRELIVFGLSELVYPAAANINAAVIAIEAIVN